MYLTCALGHSHWGVLGAAGGLIVARTPTGPRVLLTLRSPAVHHPNTWSTPGGAIDPADADAHAAACREIAEELVVDIRSLVPTGEHVFSCGGWRYVTVLLVTPEPFPVDTTGWETQRAEWLDLPAVDALGRNGQLHPGFAASWPALQELIVASPVRS